MKNVVFICLSLMTISCFVRLGQGCCRKDRGANGKIEPKKEGDGGTQKSQKCDGASKERFGTVISPNLRFHVGTTDGSGNPVFKEVNFTTSQNNAVRNSKVTLPYPYGPTRVRRNAPVQNFENDYVERGGMNWSSLGPLPGMGRADNKGPNIPEVLVVVEKAWADIFKQDHCAIVNYLASYFAGINELYKTLASVDISFRIVGIIVMESPEAESFLYPGKRCNSIMCRIDLFEEWVIQQKAWIVAMDLSALFLKYSRKQSGGADGVAFGCLPCNGTAVWYDEGKFDENSYLGPVIGAHELGHNFCAKHDEVVGCSSNHVMAALRKASTGKTFSECSDRDITRVITSDVGACLRGDENG